MEGMSFPGENGVHRQREELRSKMPAGSGTVHDST
jgi:hypothetical protein